MTERPRLLYVSPVVPAVTGNGLAMRAAAVLRALTAHARVTLLIVPLYEPRRAVVAAEIAGDCERVVNLGAGDALAQGEAFDVVHVYQLAALPHAEPWLRQAGWTQLDLADVESLSRGRIAALLARNGELAAARREERAANQAKALEREALVRFDRVSVCSEPERQALTGAGGGGVEVVVLPNTLPQLETTPLPPPADGPFALLFVGTLGYSPNADAARYVCTEILPLVQAAAERPVTLAIVGAGAAAGVRDLAARPGVTIARNVPDVAPFYRDAHVAVVPIRAGGGTRLKILEAFQRGRPVVTTTLGVEGITAENGRHALIVDDPEAFAAACLRLLHDPALAARIVAAGSELFSRAYTDETLARSVASLMSATRHGGQRADAAPPAPR